MQDRLFGIGAQALTPDGCHITMDEASREQFANDKSHTAGRMEMVHIGLPVGIDTRQQRRNRRNIVHILPGEDDPGSPRHGRNMQSVIG